ncbi:MULTISPECIES: DUF4331 family protein [Amycolatopsis]|uniref:DUF4331 domain-containing protein n=2 Tax=Amycolatopsis TaxID=1813 RepID=A0A1I3XFT3_9PSEU|nr:DUF4331 family protein [Amycolatopsis sacchari]SFK18427.1 protein of unknown function [Amycolatopsis sacchari]
MSHHLDSPLARQDVRLDITDLYVFRGETGTALVIDVSHSLGEPPVPGFHPEGMYEFKIDLDGDAVEDVTYRLVFAERDSSGDQRYSVRKITGTDARDPFAGGDLIAEGTTGGEVRGRGGERLWAGKAGDPFWIEPTVLHAVGHAVQDGTRVELGAWTPAEAVNLFAGHTVHSIVLELPDTEFGEGQRIGVWAVASLQTDAGGWRSVNRVGLPMIHPLFTQFDERLGDDLNAGRPVDDPATYGPLLTRKIAGIVAAYGTAEDPGAYARRVTERFLPNILPYTVGSPASFGFLEWNGRALTDNAPDVMFSTAANTPVALGIGKESVAARPSSRFPYVPLGAVTSGA